jgi:hypothetical protein
LELGKKSNSNKWTCPVFSLDWTDEPFLYNERPSVTIKIAVKVFGEKDCGCKDVPPIYFTFQIGNAKLGKNGKPVWDNMGMELVNGIDDKKDPKPCLMSKLKWN